MSEFVAGRLILADGSCFDGLLLNGREGSGEVVFNTGMTGYQEVLTDPSYAGQIVTMTYPLIGNYGVNPKFDQARQAFVRGFITAELCHNPSNCCEQGTIVCYLEQRNIPCLTEVDTRAVTRTIRNHGAMQGRIVRAEREISHVLADIAGQSTGDVVAEVTTPEIYRIPKAAPAQHVVVMDFGIKQNILNSLSKYGCDLTVVPATTDAQTILSLNPDGIFLSNGPGDPKVVTYAIETIRQLLGKKPMFGICLGHQLLAIALGGDTYKLKFGHRGVNHPVKDLSHDRVYITSQNHGYVVDESTIAKMDVTVTHRAVNDGTIEGMKHNRLPVFSVQYHPEAAPGPDDNVYLFDQFTAMMKEGR